MSNGKKWKDGHKVHRDHKRGYSYKCLGSSHHGQIKWPFRSLLKNDRFFDFENTEHMSMRKLAAHEIWYYD